MDYFNGISAVATAIGVIMVFIQLLSNSKIERTKFESDIVIRFIAITNDISFYVMYLKPDSDKFEELVEEKLEGFYKYFDLTNQEFFLMEDNRISKKTKEEWKCGIIELMNLPSFQYAWKRISSIIPENTFTQLKSNIRKWKKDGKI